MPSKPTSRNQPPTGSGKLISLSGLGGAFLFCLAIAAVRGGARLARHTVTTITTPPPAAAEHQPEQSAIAAKAMIESMAADVARRQTAWREIAAAQTQLGLSDDVLEEVLRVQWRSDHPQTARKPWEFQLGDWRQSTEWDVEVLKRRLQGRATEVDKPSPSTHIAPFGQAATPSLSTQ